MTEHVLDHNTDESSYFAKLSKNGKAAYRRAVYTLTGDLPIWAKGLRKVYTQFNPKVYTQAAEVVTSQVVTLDKAESDRLQPGYVDPLTLI